jgi:hypothetical protein
VREKKAKHKIEVHAKRLMNLKSKAKSTTVVQSAVTNSPSAESKISSKISEFFISFNTINNRNSTIEFLLSLENDAEMYAIILQLEKLDYYSDEEDLYS